MSAPRAERRVDQRAGSSTAALVIAWAIVGVPAAWGVLQTVTKALALFR